MRDGLYGVLLADGSWWPDTDLDPMVGAKSTIYKNLERDRQIAEFVPRLIRCKIVPVHRHVVLTRADTHDKRRK